MLREQIADSMKAAQKGQDRKRTSTLRLIHAAIVDRDIALRGKGKDRADDEEVLDILAKMVKQREESSTLYTKGGRQDLAEQELTEIGIIKEFMPEQLDDAELDGVIAELVEETGAQSLRDMGKIMGLLKERYRGQVDMGRAGAKLKEKLG
ncbi:MAG: GatB/YqeY domain-containing protein [Phyllobacteriaceae bacterium]|nr:GatB/YqeY domain-containing protein [Phyllobacteriaceae bacterium]